VDGALAAEHRELAGEHEVLGVLGERVHPA